MAMAWSVNPEENRQTLVKDEKVKCGSYPHVVCCYRKKCLLFNDVVIIATLHTGFNRRAKSFEMILTGCFFKGIGAGRTPHYSMLMWLLSGGYRNLPAGSTWACTVTPVEHGTDWGKVRWAVLCLQEVCWERNLMGYLNILLKVKGTFSAYCCGGYIANSSEEREESYP